jgi:hypothetical protein
MTPEEYKALFEKYGVKPATGIYIAETHAGYHCACAVGIRVVELMGSVDEAWWAGNCSDGYTGTMVVLAGLSSAFVRGLDDGWEGSTANHVYYPASAEYVAGYAEGAAAGDAIKPTKYF